MRISDVKTYVLGTAWRNLTYVELHTDEGLVGVGEVRMLNHTDAHLGSLAAAAPTMCSAAIRSTSKSSFGTCSERTMPAPSRSPARTSSAKP